MWCGSYHQAGPGAARTVAQPTSPSFPPLPHPKYAPRLQVRYFVVRFFVSSMIPTILDSDNRVIAVMGASGWTKIIMAVV